METAEVTSYWLTRFCFQRALGFVYFIAFLIVAQQYIPLVGSRGLLPAKLFLRQINFWDAPSLFWLNSSDHFFTVMAWLGVFFSLLALTGLSDAFGIFFSAFVWAFLWITYLSFVNVGEVFYGFGWESILLETGFLAIFFGSSNTMPPKIIILLLRWVLFRVMFGAGLIKIRGDSCWRDLTCLQYHYETQPLPNPLSWYLHWMPAWYHKMEVLFTHFVELVVPWGAFGPRLVCYGSGLLMIFFQLSLILSGNLSWLNYITIVLCIPCFDDRFLSRFIPLKIPDVEPLSAVHKGVIISVTVLILLLSIQPATNLISSRQTMNRNYDPFHLVNTYGAFGSVTRKRMEIVLEGTDEAVIGPSTEWREYDFKCKPGNLARAPCIVSPYHYRLDWQMWFAAMSSYPYHPWILNLVAKLLEGDPATLGLLGTNPFSQSPPKNIRARLYEYHFTTWAEKKKTGAWWRREFAWDYLPPLSLSNERFRDLIHQTFRGEKMGTIK